MKVLATRDDGAQLIGDPSLSHAALVSDASCAIMHTASALSRGTWADGDGSEAKLPRRVEDRIRAASTEYGSQ
jgi:hypothetical protein